MTVLSGQDLPRDGEGLNGSALEARLVRTWGDAPGFWGWLTTVDHKRIARRYIVTALCFMALAGFSALWMRLQLAAPENAMMGPDRYNQLFTMHGTTMMFLFAVPIMEAMGIYLVPLMIGTRNISFPRLNAFSYWMYLAGGVMVWLALFLNVGPDAGWFAYTPLSGPQFSPGKRVDMWAQMITFTEVAGLAVAVATTATILKQRAPGMTLARMPIFVWTMLVTALMIIFSLPSVALASALLICDRLIGTHFYNAAEHGSPLLWQHLFWFFGHPEVYIIFLPGAAFVSEIVGAFSRRPVFGYPAIVVSVVATGLLAFGLWVHHMFATGLPRLGYAFYTAASMTVAIPSGVQIFCWLATMWDGRPRFQVPLLWVVGFIVTFVIGGLTGVMLASVPIDLQVHDTYFVVAHFHYVLVGGAVFPLLGAFTYWFPKFTGRMMDETLGRIAFWMIFLAFQVTFFPMHFLGLMGMPRRVYTYPTNMGWDDLNMLATLGAFVLGAGFVLFLVNGIFSYFRGRVAGANPWDASSLEWAAASPPPQYNFPHIPVVASRNPLWDNRDHLPVMTGLRVDDRELLLTTVMEAKPDVRDPSAMPSIWPLWAALSTTCLFVASVFTPWAVVIGAFPVGAALIGWFWPKTPPSVEPVIE